MNGTIYRRLAGHLAAGDHVVLVLDMATTMGGMLGTRIVGLDEDTVTVTNDMPAENPRRTTIALEHVVGLMTGGLF